MKLKKVLAIGLVATMVTSSSLMALAAEEETGGTSGNGKLEGTVDTEVFNVVLPTVAEDGSALAFILDPEGLISKTKSAAYASATFGDGTLFFKNSASAANNYSNTSDKLTIVNKSSVKADVTVTAKITNHTGIALSADKTFADDTTASMYMAIIDSTNTDGVAITEANGATVTATINAAADGAYEYSYADGKYKYAIKSDAADSLFSKYEFQLTGAANANGDWSELSTAAPTLELVWKVVKHSDAVANDADVTVSADTASVTWDRISALTVKVDSSVADLSTGDVGIIYNGTTYCYNGVYNGDTTLNTNTLVSVSGDIITVNASAAKYLPEGAILYIVNEEKTITARVTVN